MVTQQGSDGAGWGLCPVPTLGVDGGADVSPSLPACLRFPQGHAPCPFPPCSFLLQPLRRVCTPPELRSSGQPAENPGRVLVRCVLLGTQV